MNTEDQIQKFIEEKAPVTIKYSSDLPDLFWAVEVDGSNEFWLDCFNSLPKAIKFCVGNGLPYTVMGLTKTPIQPPSLSEDYLYLDKYIEENCRDNNGMLDVDKMKWAINNYSGKLINDESLLIYSRLFLKRK